VDQEFLDEAKLELTDLVNSGDLDSASITVSVAQILTTVPAPLAAMMGILIDTAASALYFPATSDQNGQINAFGTPA
jgi:hypothetical protein